MVSKELVAIFRTGGMHEDGKLYARGSVRVQDRANLEVYASQAIGKPGEMVYFLELKVTAKDLEDASAILEWAKRLPPVPPVPPITPEE